MHLSMVRAIQSLWHIVSEGLYEDQDEFAEVIAWFFQARFGNMSEFYWKSLSQSSSPSSLSSIKRSSSSSSLSSIESTKSDEHILEQQISRVRRLSSDGTMKHPSQQSISDFSPQWLTAVRNHVKVMLRFPEEVSIPFEALQYWLEYTGTAQLTAMSLFEAGINRKVHDLSDDFY